VNGLQVLTGLTQLRVKWLTGVSSESALQLPGLQHLEMHPKYSVRTSMPLLSSCTQLRVLALHRQRITVLGPGCLVASTMLQRLELVHCEFRGAGGATDSFRWQHVFQGPGQLPHLTSLKFKAVPHSQQGQQQADVELMVKCCSSLRQLHIKDLPDSCAPALARLSGLTSLHLCCFWSREARALARLTGLRELRITRAARPGTLAAGLRHLSGLEHLTSLGFGCELQHGDIGEELSQLVSDRLPGCLHAIVNKVRVWEGLPMVDHDSGMQCNSCKATRWRDLAAIAAYLWATGARHHGVSAP